MLIDKIEEVLVQAFCFAMLAAGAIGAFYVVFHTNPSHRMAGLALVAGLSSAVSAVWMITTAVGMTRPMKDWLAQLVLSAAALIGFYGYTRYFLRDPWFGTLSEFGGWLVYTIAAGTTLASGFACFADGVETRTNRLKRRARRGSA